MNTIIRSSDVTAALRVADALRDALPDRSAAEVLEAHGRQLLVLLAILSPGPSGERAHGATTPCPCCHATCAVDFPHLEHPDTECRLLAAICVAATECGVTGETVH